LAGERGAGEEAAAADRGDDDLEVRVFLEQLQDGGRLAVDDVPVVERVDHASVHARP